MSGLEKAGNRLPGAPTRPVVARRLARVYDATELEIARVEHKAVVAVAKVQAVDYAASNARTRIAGAVGEEEMLINMVGGDDPMVRGRVASLLRSVTEAQTVSTMRILGDLGHEL